MRQNWKSFSVPGLLAGTLFFAASLTPSLLPRPLMLQGIVSGLSLAAGYAVGVFVRWLWSYLELPVPGSRVERIMTVAAATACALAAAAFLWQASDWQNSIRVLMELEPVDGSRPFTVGLITILVFGFVLALGKAFRQTFLLLTRRFKRVVPRRLSNVIGIVAAAALFWMVIEGVLFRSALRAADASYRQVDALIEADTAAPTEPHKSGSPESLVSWAAVGRAGREFISSGVSAADLGAFFGEEALEPIRVYVGLNSAETVPHRARLALDELRRVRAFERSVLIIVTPTGTGYVDPAAMDAVEYLHRGDIASVAVQYSYLPSALSLIAEADYGAETASAVFSAVYGYWSSLPKHDRPRLYLHGLSLGALNSDLSFDLYDIVGDTIQGALWSGPPFRSETWSSVTARRNPGSPAWLPRFRDSSIIRFTNQQNRLHIPGASWGPVRIVYLQYASDPVTFFEPRSLYRQPDWMAGPRGPDVSPELRWYPVVTMLQLAADMLAGGIAPDGYGHEYATAHYIDAWIEVTEPSGWVAREVARLNAHLTTAE